MNTSKIHPNQANESELRIDHECKIAALLLLRSIAQENTSETWIAINNHQHRTFGDLVLYRQTNDGKEVIYLITIKYNKDFDVTNEIFKVKHRAVLLSTYSDSNIEKKNKNDKETHIVDYLWEKRNQIVSLVLVNSDFSDSNFPCYIEANSNLDNEWMLYETIDANARIFQFDSSESDIYSFMEKFFVCTTQLHQCNLDTRIKNLIQPLQISETLLNEVTNKLITFFKERSTTSGYLLEKSCVSNKIADLLLEPYKIKLEQPKDDRAFQQSLWNDIIRSKDVTIISNADDVTMQFVQDYIHNSIKMYLKDPETRKDTLDGDIYKLLWKTGQIPLLIQVVDLQNMKRILNILKFSPRIRIIICTENNWPLAHPQFPHWFINLGDLETHHQERILSMPLKLQGRMTIELKNYVKPQSCASITVKDVIYIMLDKINVGNDLEALPYCADMYLQRTWLKAEVLLQIRDEIFVITCNCSCNEFLRDLCIDQTEVSQWRSIEHNLKARIIIISDSEQDLTDIATFLTGKTVHYLILHTKHGLEWIQSEGTTRNVRKFRDSIAESMTAGQAVKAICSKRSLTLISGDSETSDFLDYIAYNASDNLLALKVDLVQYKEEFAKWQEEILIDTDSASMLNWMDIHAQIKYPLRSAYFKIFLKIILKSYKCSKEQYMYDIISAKRLKYFEHLALRIVRLKWTKSLAEYVIEMHCASKNILLLLDGFDDLPASNQDGAKRFIQFISSLGFSTCVTTTHSSKHHLEYWLDTFAVDLDKRSVGNQLESEATTTKEFKTHRQYCALKAVFDEEDLKELYLEKNLSLFESPLDILCPVQKGSAFRRQYAQVLAADWLAENINSDYKNIVVKLVKKLFDPRYYNVRKRFDCILAKDCPLLLAVINGHVEEAKQMLASMDDLQKCDNANRSVFHLIPAWSGQHGLTLLEQIPQHKWTSRDSLLGYIPLDYALIAGSLNVANAIQAKLGRQQIISVTSADVRYMLYYGESDLRTDLIKNEHTQNVDYLLTAMFVYHLTNIDQTDLHIAAMYGQTYVVNVLLSKKKCTNTSKWLDINEQKKFLLSLPSKKANPTYLEAKDKKHKTPLHWAAHYGHLDTVKLLLTKGANPSAMTANFRSPLHYAAINGHTEIAELLLPGNEKPNTVTPLHLASYYGHVATIELFLAKGLEKNAKTFMSFTPLHCAAFNGHKLAVDLLLSYGVDIEAKTKAQLTPLNYAAYKGHTDVIHSLLSKGANIEAKDNQCMTSLHWATCNGHIAATKILLLNRADQEAKDDTAMTPLHWAAHCGYAQVVDALLANGSNKEAKDNSGMTPLHWAAQKDHSGAIELLLFRGANIAASDDSGMTPLHWAACKGHARTVDILIARKPKIEAQDNKLMTPLHWAAQTGYNDAIELLLFRGANIAASDDSGMTPLHWAACNGRIDSVKLLLVNGSDIDAKDHECMTPLHWAARRDRDETAKFLLDKGATFSLDAFQRSPLDWARRNYHQKTELVLAEADQGPSCMII